jgi:hypothetical protein
MRYAVLVVLGIFLAGCAGHTASNSNSQAIAQPQANQTAAAANTDDSNPPAPPVGAQYTLHCATFTGPTHILDAKRMKDELVHGTGSKQWYLVHSADESDLYYGFYKTFDDHSQVQEYARAHSDLAKVATLVDQDGQRIFSDVSFVPVDTPDPPAPRAWDLSSNPGYWTLQIAVYKGSVQRKQMAVDAVRGFRQHGVEAYFRHGRATSEVYIGSWPKTAVAAQQSNTAEESDPDEQLLVLPQSFAGAENDTVYRSNGQKVKVVVPKLQIVDPSLKLATQEYPYYYVNGEVVGHRVQLADHTWKVVPWPSYLIQVPHNNASDDDSQAKTDENQDVGEPPADSPQPTAPTVPGLPGLGGFR